MQVIPTTAWARYIAGGPIGTVYLGQRIALFVDAASGEALARALAADAPTVARFLSSLEALWARLEGLAGAVPLTQSFRGRAIVEVAFLEGAAGLAHHGRGGLAVGPAFLHESIEGGFVSHAFGYEATRNFISPERFTPPFKYACAEGPGSWGWVNQGFVNIIGCILSTVAPTIGFRYYGRGPEEFRASMEAHLLVYLLRLHGVGGARLGARDVFLHERLPWAPTQSLDNLFSGIISLLCRAHGANNFLVGFFRALPTLPPSRDSYELSLSNFAVASAWGAGRDMAPFFRGLGWPV